MGMLDLMLTPDLMKKASEAVQIAETKRRLAAKKILIDIAKAMASGQNAESVAEARLGELMSATSQAPAVREVGKVVAASKVMGAGLIGEVFGKVADKLDGK